VVSRCQRYPAPVVVTAVIVMLLAAYGVFELVWDVLRMLL
jgi:hypothetical protein